MSDSNGRPLTEASIGDYYPLAYKTAWRYVWRPECDLDDLVQYGMLGLLEAMRERSSRYLPPPKDGFAFATTVFSRWMPYWYHAQEQDYTYEAFEAHYAETLPAMTGIKQYLGDVAIEVYLSEVEFMLGATSALIASNLVSPSPAVVDLAMEEMADKKVRHAAGENVRGYNTCRIKHEHIRKALGLDEGAWGSLLKEVRVFTRGVLSRGLRTYAPTVG